MPVFDQGRTCSVCRPVPIPTSLQTPFCALNRHAHLLHGAFLGKRSGDPHRDRCDPVCVCGCDVHHSDYCHPRHSSGCAEVSLSLSYVCCMAVYVIPGADHGGSVSQQKAKRKADVQDHQSSREMPGQSQRSEWLPPSSRSDHGNQFAWW